MIRSLAKLSNKVLSTTIQIPISTSSSTIPDIFPFFNHTNTSKWSDPSTYIIDCSSYDMSQPPDSIPELASKIKSQFKNQGIILLKATNLQNKKEMIEKWSTYAMGGTMSYEGGANDRQNLDEKSNLLDVGAPGHLELHYHHEMAQTGFSCESLAFSAIDLQNLRVDLGQGQSWLSDGIMVTDEMRKTTLGKKLEKYGVCCIRNFTDADYFEDKAGNWRDWKYLMKNRTDPDQYPVNPGDQVYYNHWQQAFNTNDPKSAISKAKSQHFECSFKNNILHTKLFLDAYEHFPLLDKNILFFNVAEHGTWFDTHIGIDKLPHIGCDEVGSEFHRPYKLVLGDMSEFSHEELEEWNEVYCKHGFQVGGEAGMETGDISIFCNFRFAHGRPGYELEEGQKREIGVVIGKQFIRNGAKEGSW